MEVIIKGEPKEIAALVEALQERRGQRRLMEKFREAGIDPFQVECGIRHASSDTPGPIITAE